MPSKHPKAGLLIQRGVYDDLHSFAELERRISVLADENTKLVGDAFEVFVEAYLATHQKMQAKTVWLVGQVPLDIRQQLNLPNDAKGIDGIFRTRTGTLVPYQVKFRSQRAYLTYTEIAPFLGLTERATDRIVFTNSDELAEDVKNRDAMRTVRGIDFDDLTEDDFWAICCWLKEQPVAIPKLTPRDPDQLEALARISEALATSNRAHVVMACGTGKTLVALWAAEALNSKTILVLVPSLTLLQQTLDEWSRHNSWRHDFTYLCVCSDPTVAARDANDPIHLDATDLDFHVDTNPVEVRRFMERETSGVKVVFSTYQSSPVVSEGMRGLAPFDLAIFDEAHRTTGPQGGLFAHSLRDENIRIRKRLFFTATPRHYDIRHRDKEGDFRVISMDDETVYGPRAYTQTFGLAARQGIICNYKVVISVVDGQEINDLALKHGITLVEGDVIRARWVANQIAIERAIEKTGAKRVITFHSRVSSAKEFSSDGTRGIKQFLPDFSVFHINGEQKSSERKQLIRSFRQAAKEIVTNARCLTEGIDVPAVDMVAFIDPRHSRVDIAQATGRAMRKPRGADKRIGYVVIPLFLERRSGETVEEALERSEFDDVANVLNAMQEQDEELVQIIREQKEASGRGAIFDPRRLSEKIEVLGPSIGLSALRTNVFAEIVDIIGVSWDEWYGRLKLYKEREGHCRVPQFHLGERCKLGTWVSGQRKIMNELPLHRRQRLDDIGFVWDAFESAWEEGFEALKQFNVREGHCDVPKRHMEEASALGHWVIRQRKIMNDLPLHRRQRLDDIGFVWDPLDSAWKEGFAALTKFKAREGHCRVPDHHVEAAFRLGTWVANQRSGKDILSPERRQSLDTIEFEWDSLNNARWEKGFTALTKFNAREGHCRVPAHHFEGAFKLGQWVGTQRRNRDTLTAEFKQRLDDIGFIWDPLDGAWKAGFAALNEFKVREGHCRVPQRYVEGTFKLGVWVNSQRNKKETLPAERRRRLDDIGFVWDPIEVSWEDGFAALTKFKAREGHCRVPQNHIEGNFRLGQWVGWQRKYIDSIPSERKKRFDAIGFAWDGLNTARWERGFIALSKFTAREGHCRVPYRHVEGIFKLGAWVNSQRNKHDTLPTERRRRLDEIGFVWRSKKPAADPLVEAQELES